MKGDDCLPHCNCQISWLPIYFFVRNSLFPRRGMMKHPPVAGLLTLLLGLPCLPTCAMQAVAITPCGEPTRKNELTAAGLSGTLTRVPF